MLYCKLFYSIMSKQVQKSHQSEQREERSSESRSRSREKQRLGGTHHVGRPAKRQILRRREQSPPSENELESEVGREPNSKTKRPEIVIMQEFMQFYSDIGQDKGLVGTESERKEIIRLALRDSQLARIMWTPQHEWNPERQREKLLNCGKRFSLDLAKSTHARLYSIIFGVSSIFGQQFTEELYQVMLKVYLILTEETISDNCLCQFKYEGDKGEINDFFLDDDGNLKEKLSQQSINEQPNQIEDQVQREQSLIDLASAINENRNGEYYFLSFNFRKTKPRSASKKGPVSPEDRAKAYQKLILTIYEVIKNDAPKLSVHN